MKQEVKFRAWYENLNLMIEDVPIWKMSHFHHSDTSPTNMKFSECVLEQYINIKDKNGKEIFEGDLLKHNNNIFKVRFSKNQFVFLLRDINPNSKSWRSLEWANNVSKYIEIIGNINQNKEFLK
jgi:uncharacterized phage protein (TIGR01671 family)